MAKQTMYRIMNVATSKNTSRPAGEFIPVSDEWVDDEGLQERFQSYARDQASFEPEARGKFAIAIVEVRNKNICEHCGREID